MTLEIDEQINELEPGWEGVKTISYQDFEAQLNCYKYDDFYEIKF